MRKCHERPPFCENFVSQVLPVRRRGYLTCLGDDCCRWWRPPQWWGRMMSAPMRILGSLLRRPGFCCLYNIYIFFDVCRENMYRFFLMLAFSNIIPPILFVLTLWRLNLTKCELNKGLFASRQVNIHVTSLDYINPKMIGYHGHAIITFQNLKK